MIESSANNECLEEARSTHLLVDDPTGASAVMRALDVLETTGRHNELAGIAVDALVSAGRMDDAFELANDALASSSKGELQTGLLHRAMSWLMFVRGRFEESRTEAEAALEQRDCPEFLFAEAVQMQLLSLLALGQLDQARDVVATMLLGHTNGRDSALPGITIALALMAWDSGRVSEAIGLLRAASAREGQGRGETPESHPRLYLAAMLTSLSENEEALKMIDEEEWEDDGTDKRLWSAAWPILRSRLSLDAGHRNDAIAQANLGLAIASQLDTPFLAPIAASILATSALRSGDIEYATRLMDRCKPTPSMALLGSTAFLSARARIIETRYGIGAALEALAEGKKDPLYLTHLLLADPTAGAWWVRIALQEGLEEQAAEIAYCANHLASENYGIASLAAVAAHTGGLLYRQPERLEEAAATYTQPWAQASALEDAATMLAERDWNAARQSFDRAAAAYESTGATRDAARVRLRRSRIAGRPSCGWASLTETEQNVVTYVADGLTNAQVGRRMFLSRHTVDFHLRQVFRKLDINSRVELVGLAFTHRHGILRFRHDVAP